MSKHIVMTHYYNRCNLTFWEKTTVWSPELLGILRLENVHNNSLIGLDVLSFIIFDQCKDLRIHFGMIVRDTTAIIIFLIF